MIFFFFKASRKDLSDPFRIFPVTRKLTKIFSFVYEQKFYFLGMSTIFPLKKLFFVLYRNWVPKTGAQIFFHDVSPGSEIGKRNYGFSQIILEDSPY